MYGGAAPNPIVAIAEIICALKDRDGRILVPGFYDAVVPPSAKEREAWARLPFDEREYTEKEMGAKELVGEPGVPLFERLWGRPTVEVHGFAAAHGRAKTVIRRAQWQDQHAAGSEPDGGRVSEVDAGAVKAATRAVAAELKELQCGRFNVDQSDNNRFIHAARGRRVQ